jgi:hypothetical protein
MEDLTKVQQGLVNDLITEFKKINPKPKSGTSRFGLETITECVREEERFTQTIKKHNATMSKLFKTQLKDDVKEFQEEFGEFIDVEVGYRYAYGQNTKDNLNNGIDSLKAGNGSSSEVHLCLVSKVRIRNYDSSYNYFNGKAYHKIYVSFKRESVSTTLKSGKKVSLSKIIGLNYNTEDWLHRDRGESYGTLDSMIQGNEKLQQTIVSLATE